VSRLHIENCEVVVTMDHAGTEIPGGSILIEDGIITWVGAGRPPRFDSAARVDGSGCIALPGLVNTHHHLYQTLTRVHAQDQGLFGWLKALYPLWADLDAEWVAVAARVGLAELALSGCTTTTDHHYIFPPGRTGLLEAEIEAARLIGLRFHPCRGSMDLGASHGGLPPDAVVQDADTILAETEEAVRRFHDPRPGSMLRVAVAPCSPFSVTPRLMTESAALARRLGVRLHTHIAETKDEEAYCRETFGRRPVQLLDDLGWMAGDVWLAHCVHINDREIEAFARSATGVAWCPTSNLRLGSGIAPVRGLLRAGARVGLGVDGSASNDGGNLLAEARLGMLGQRLDDAAGMSARQVLRVATRGGAACLGREEIGSLEPGKRGDVAVFPVDGLEFAGAEADLVAALASCDTPRVRDLFVEGRPVVRDGRLVGADEHALAEEGRLVGRRIAEGDYRRIKT
jgi:cytosine/adenosine deaminase-related metal-dependent hydrolase